MNKLTLLILPLFLASCAGDYAAAQGIQSTPRAAMIASTQASVPTADMSALVGELAKEKDARQQAEDSERAKQLQIDELVRLQLEYTVTAESIKMQGAQMTQAAELAYMTATAQSIMATQASSALTATAYPTAAEIQRQSIALVNAQLTAAAEYPDLLIKKTEAEQYEKNAPGREAARFAAIAFFCFAMFALAFYLVAHGVKTFQIAENLKREAPAEIPDMNEVAEKEPMHFVPVNGNPNQLKVTQKEIPCPLGILLFIADEITKGNRTFGIGQWTGTVAHKVMVRGYFRTWALHEDLIVEVPGKNGEVMIVEKGKMFFEDTSELREPPLPYRCPIESITNEVK